MFYALDLKDFPVITQYYTVVRNTVWQIADKDHILILIKDGQCTVSCDGNTYSLQAGDVFFIPARHSYLRKPIGDGLCTMTYIHFSIPAEFLLTDAETVCRQLRQTKERLDLEILSGETCLSYPSTLYLRNQTSFGEPDLLTESTRGINLFSDRRKLLCNLQSSLALCNLLLMLSQRATEALIGNAELQKGDAIPQKLRRAIGYIARHYSEPIRLDTLAAYCNLSKQQLIRHFKTHMHTTPIHYITDYRLARAKDLLFNQPQLSVKEISAELGFENQRYFARVFFKHNRETPTQYRDRTVNYSQQKEELL